MDIVSGDNYPKNVVLSLNEFMNSCGLYDTWRLFHPSVKELSWSRRNDFVPRRIDYAFTSESVFNDVLDCSMHSVPFSDHRCIQTVIKCSQFERGPGYWSFNNNMLRDPDFVYMVNELIDMFLRENVVMSFQDKLGVFEIKN